ncbi:putative RHO1 - GTP-binding protein of the rho subfamily of ras-like proteins [Balamuthia mandrillaris]
MCTKGIKLVVVGDGAVGKTCLLLSYAQNRPPATDEYIPTIFENYVVCLTAGDDIIELSLWDTAGQEEYDRLRPLSYGNADVVLLCFSVDNPTSFENVTSRWSPELRHYIPNVPTVLVGTKKDRRNAYDTTGRFVKPEEALNLAKTLKAKDYVECSAITGENLKQVFDTAVKTVLFSACK